MVTDFRCQHCGMMVNAAADVCPSCNKQLEIPLLLHMLPRPHFAGEPSPAAVASVDLAAAGELDGRFETLARAMPWVLSFMLHLGVALILMFFWMIAKNRAVIAVPQTDITALPPGPDERTPMKPDGWPTPNNSNNPTKEPSINFPNRNETIKLSGRPDGSPNENLKKGSIGPIGIGTPWGAGGPDLRGRIGDGIFVPPGGGGGGRSFTGSVVYVIDRSGSMVDSFDQLSRGLLSSVSLLQSPAKFHVIFFCDARPQENNFRCLTEPTQEAKIELANFVKEIRAAGMTDPMPALERALEVLNDSQAPAPKVIHLLTDGEFPNNAKVLDLVRTKAIPKGITIQTYLYGLQAEQAEKILRTIAKETGGNYRFINPL